MNNIPKLYSAEFHPTGVARLAIESIIGGRSFVLSRLLDTTTLPTDAQSTIGASLAWLGSQLGEGYIWSSIVLRRVPDGNPATYSAIGDDDDPETFAPVIIAPACDSIVAAIYGSHPDLGQSVIPQGALVIPFDLLGGLLAVWDGVEQLLQTP